MSLWTKLFGEKKKWEYFPCEVCGSTKKTYPLVISGQAYTTYLLESIAGERCVLIYLCITHYRRYFQVTQQELGRKIKTICAQIRVDEANANQKTPN